MINRIIYLVMVANFALWTGLYVYGNLSFILYFICASAPFWVWAIVEATQTMKKELAPFKK